MLIDTHCHLSKNDYDNLDEIISEMDGYMITSGCDDETNKEVLEMIAKYDNVYGTIGIHPEEIDKITENSFKFIEDNLNNPKIVAIGEIGLDYYWVKDNIEKQKEVFEYQVKLAEKYNIPIVVHSREAIQDTYDILKKYKVTGTIHCFSSSLEMAKEFIKIGALLGIGGVLTFKNSHLYEVVDALDITSFVTETDCPYLTPAPNRGKRNEPAYLVYIVEKMAEIKKMQIDEISDILYQNAKEILRIKDYEEKN